MASGAIGLALLMASTVVVGYGNYLQANGGTPAQAVSNPQGTVAVARSFSQLRKSRTCMEMKMSAIDLYTY